MAGSKTAPVRHLKRLVHVPGEVAGVIHAARRRGVGQRAGRHEIAAADFRRAKAGLKPRLLDQPFDQIGRFRTARTAIGIGRHRVGVDARRRHEQRRHIIEPRGHGRADEGDERAILVQIGAHGRQHMDAQAKNTAIGIQRQICGGDVVAPVRIRDEMVHAVASPLHRTAQLLRREEAQRIFPVDEHLGAEAAAHFRGDDTQPCRIDAEDILGDDVPLAMAALRARSQRIAAAVRIIFRKAGARLHIVCHEPVVDEADGGDMRGLAEGFFRLCLVTMAEAEGLVGAMLRPDERCPVLSGFLDIDDHIERLIIHLDQFRRRLGRIDAVSNDEGNGIAHMADGIGAKHWPHRAPVHGAVQLLHHRLHRHRLHAVKVSSGQHHRHARMGAGLIETGDGDPGVGHGGAQHIGMQRAFGGEVIRVAACAGDQGRIFLAADRGTDPEFLRRHLVHLETASIVMGRCSHAAGGDWPEGAAKLVLSDKNVVPDSETSTPNSKQGIRSSYPQE